MTTNSTGCWLVFLGLLVGCGSAEKSEPVYAVAGLVTVDGAPLTGAKTQTVSFMPLDPKQVAMPTADIGSDGRYVMTTLGKKGAPLGKYKVCVFASNESADNVNPYDKDGKLKKVESLINSKYTAKETTDLTVEVTASPSAGQYDLKLSK